MSFKFALSSLRDSVPSTKALIEGVTTFLFHVLPPILCYFVMAGLAITPRTRAVRIALFPVIVLSALRAAVPLDMSLKNTERKFHHNFAVSIHFDIHIL